MSRIFRNLTLLWILVCWAEKTTVTFFKIFIYFCSVFLHNNTVYLGNTCFKHNSLYGRKYCPPRWPILCTFGSCFLIEASGLHRLLNAWAIRYSCKFEKRKQFQLIKTEVSLERISRISVLSCRQCWIHVTSHMCVVHSACITFKSSLDPGLTKSNIANMR